VADTRRQLLEQPGPILFDEGSHLVIDHVDVRVLDEAPDLFELFGREIVKSGASILLRFFDLAAGGNACLKGRLEAYRLVVLLQEVSEGRAGYLLKALTSLACDCLNRLPRLVIELDALADH
jgi:hypothetical protein